MKKFEINPLELDTGLKTMAVFNDLITLHAGVLDFIEKYERQIETLEKHLSDEDIEKVYYTLTIVPKVIAELAPTVNKELSIEEGPK